MKLWFERGAWASKQGRKSVAALSVEEVGSIAVIRHAALGDMVLLRPFLFELRRFFPNASITLSLVSNYIYGAPEELVDRIHTIHGSDQRDVSRLKQYKKIKELGQHDIIFDLASTSRSQLVVLLNKAKIKVGFPYRSALRHLLYDVAVLRSDYRFEADTMMDMLHVFGCNTRYPLQFDLISESKSAQRNCILYFPSASTKEKCWPHNSFAGLIGQLAAEYPNYQHVVLEGIAEWESIEGIMKSLGQFDNVEGKKAISFNDTLSILNQTRLLVSNDTGIRNLAIAAGTPSLGIFFSTIPFRYWPRLAEHDAIFEPDGSIPAISKVKRKIIAMLENDNS